MPRYVHFHCDDLRIKTRAIMTGPAILTPHHHEGWQQIQRLMRMSFPEWQGAPGWEIAIPIVFDGLRTRRSVERDVRLLERMALPTPRYDPQRPPQLWFNSFGDVPHDYSRDPSKRWIIAGSGIEWGTYFTFKPHRNAQTGSRSNFGQIQQGGGRNFDPSSAGESDPTSAGSLYHRVQQQATVHLWEYFTERIDIASMHNLHYKIKKGDTLQSISLRFYGAITSWRKIAKANKIRDPNHLKVGKTIKLP